MNILALDIATKTGWYNGATVGGGVWNLTARKDESKGMPLLRLRAKLQEINNIEPIDVIVFERPAGMHKHAIISQSEKHGICKAFCEDNGIEYRAYSAGEIKKFATGKGNAKKDQMIQACVDTYQVQPIDDNHADAIHLYYLAKQELHV